MATAVQSELPTTTASPNARLLTGSVFAAAFILGGIAVAGYGVPKLLASVIPAGANSFIAVFVRMLAQLGAVVGLVYLGGRLAGANPPKGLRGGIFLVISVAIAIFFIARAVGLNSNLPITLVVTGALLFGAFRFLSSPRAIGWMHALEEMGWFHTFSYKRTQGLRMRRYTILGLLLIGLSGVWSLMSHRYIGEGDLKLQLPFLENPISVLTDKQYSIPLLIAAAVLWLSWRAVNFPAFADFLIATEAEMVKVSWSSRKRLIQDTIVVLVTTLLLTAFLLVIDLFWGWLLSQPLVGVLPNKESLKAIQKAEQKSPEW